MRERALIVGAVAAEPAVVEAWDLLRRHFHAVGQPMEYVLHSGYERLVDALLSGQVDVAFNSPVAHLRVRRRTHQARVGLVTRDRDRDVRSVWFTQASASTRRLRDLGGGHLGVGGSDHAYSRIAPLDALREEGVDLTGVRLTVFDHEPGRHGASDHDEEAIVASVLDGRVQAGAISEPVWRRHEAEGALALLAVTAPIDGWVFDALPTLPTALREGFIRAISSLDGSAADAARTLQLFGARRMLPVREESYDGLKRAMDHQTAW